MADVRRASFEAEIVIHLSAVFRTARRLTRDDANAADLAQDTMLRAYRAFESYTTGTNGRAWVLKILYTVFVNSYHRARREPIRVSIEDLETRYGIQLAAPPETPADETTWSEPEIASALDELPEAFRITVLLVDVEGLTYEEAAQSLGCEVGTVRSRLFRARRLLAVRLDTFARDRRIRPAGGGVR